MCSIELLHNSRAYCSNLGNVGTPVTTRTCCRVSDSHSHPRGGRGGDWSIHNDHSHRQVGGVEVLPMAVAWCISSVWLYLCQYAIGGRGTSQCTLNCFAVSMDTWVGLLAFVSTPALTSPTIWSCWGEACPTTLSACGDMCLRVLAPFVAVESPVLAPCERLWSLIQRSRAL